VNTVIEVQLGGGGYFSDKLNTYWFMKKDICIHDRWSACKKFYVVHIVRFVQLTLLCTETSLQHYHQSVNVNFSNLFLSFGATAPNGPGPPHSRGF
jgi:hypothetical protein